MNEPPTDIDPADLLNLVRQTWDRSVETLAHLAVGFGAHHWQARVAGAPRYFVTLDDLGPRHSLQTLQAAYAGASALARSGLDDFVVAPIAPCAVAFAGRAVSITRWLSGAPVDVIDRRATATMLQRLHAVAPATLDTELPPWRPVVGADLADQIDALLQRPWSAGPYGAPSRDAVTAASADVRRWSARYNDLGQVAQTRPWVLTHGEPGRHNQLITASATVIVDWETLKLAPAERDLQTLGRGDRRMLELFDLEWRLDEINQYTAWFAGPHGDTADDRVAFDGLMHELTR